ncbi:MAG: hypothetical protein DRZ80_02500 [Thermoprotei archaeon]|nr:MAG: hypothetical protein DRZ80_02500 [Thermoprotei archaeon]
MLAFKIIEIMVEILASYFEAIIGIVGLVFLVLLYRSITKFEEIKGPGKQKRKTKHVIHEEEDEQHGLL